MSVVRTLIRMHMHMHILLLLLLSSSSSSQCYAFSIIAPNTNNRAYNIRSLPSSRYTNTRLLTSTGLRLLPPFAKYHGTSSSLSALLSDADADADADADENENENENENEETTATLEVPSVEENDADNDADNDNDKSIGTAILSLAVPALAGLAIDPLMVRTPNFQNSFFIN